MASEEPPADLFEGLKKKKKKKAFVEDEVSTPIDESIEQEMADLNLEEPSTDFLGDLVKKKKKKKPAEDEPDEQSQEPTHYDPSEWQISGRDYTYKELLHRVFVTIRTKNPELTGEKKRHSMIPPKVIRDGKKSIFANLSEICKKLNRSSEHLTTFLYAELGTSGSVDGAQRLIIKGKYQQKQIEGLLRQYIVEYVQCKMCKSLDTVLVKENRLTFMQCEACGSKRTVAAIKTGFQAQTVKRSIVRAAVALG